ncbi:CS domain-containing protein [Mycena venus]|uniref:CS domain-containing protein n=1 Tax=Mycena venus TaxID=2733690 RepID=A0A8H6XFA9_9AGAR|nr:CS domain-containing protein [Mycena venus]
MTTVHPEVLWAQRSSESDETKNIIYLTINLPDIQESSLKIRPPAHQNNLRGNIWKKTGHEKKYAFNLEFFSEIVPEKSSKKLSTRSLYLVLRKKENQAEYWPRLTKEKVKNAYIKTDFSKWVDEDEQDGQEAKDDADLEDAMGGMGGMPGMGGMGMPGMGGMGMPGMPGMGGMGMPGMGGMGGPGGMDFEKMMAEMGGAGGFGAGGSGGGDDDDSDDDGPPPLEDAEPAK